MDELGTKITEGKHALENLRQQIVGAQAGLLRDFENEKWHSGRYMEALRHLWGEVSECSICDHIWKWGDCESALVECVCESSAYCEKCRDGDIPDRCNCWGALYCGSCETKTCSCGEYYICESEVCATGHTLGSCSNTQPADVPGESS